MSLPTPEYHQGVDLNDLSPVPPRRSFRQRWRNWWRDLGPYKHLILFLLTVLSTFLVGGAVFSATLMTILLAHELGHYLMSRRHGIPTSLPYFIPMPLSYFGTLGAVIKMRGRMTNRRALLDIAVAGPLAGFFFTVPAIIIGLQHSAIVPISDVSPFSFRLGEPILFSVLSKLVLGSIPESHDIILHPMAFAGWIGLYVMALNLLPIGQLDGGHVLYALLGPRSRAVSLGALVLFGLIAGFYFRLWFFFIGLIILFRVYKHPPLLEDSNPIGPGRRLIGILILLLFLVSFTPIPFPDLLKYL
jgi:membrane-associated protease RseP (regulator of RpoE activity)